FGSTPPARRCTPFPYTTLFRSQRIAVVLRVAPGHCALEPGMADQGNIRFRERRIEAIAARRSRIDAHRRRKPLHRTRALGASPRDRKSTRLNSSHVKISYAVFY